MCRVVVLNNPLLSALTTELAGQRAPKKRQVYS